MGEPGKPEGAGAAQDGERRRTEAELVATATRLGQVISNAPVILWTVDRDAVVTLSEGAGLAALGLRPGQAVGHRVREEYADVDLGLRMMERALAGESSSAVLEARGVMLDVHYFPERNDRGEVVGATGIAVDVTARTRAEKAAHSARLMLTAALQQAADIIFITDREGRLVYVNPAFERQTGYTRAELLGQTPRILKSGRDGPELYRRMWETILAGDVFESVMANRKKDGEVYFEQKTIAPIRDGEGRITHFVSVGRDITRRKQEEELQHRLQEQVERSAEEWRATFDAVESPLLLVDERACVKRLNRAARDLWGTGDFSEVVGQPVAGRAGEPWATIGRTVGQALASPGSLAASASDDRGRTWDVAASPFWSPAGEPSVIVLARDISPLVALQQSLRRSETMSAMGTLLAGVAHEVRNPLFGISAAIDAFENEFGGREEYRQYLGLLRGEVARLTNLMQSLLDYGRPVQAPFAPGRLDDVIPRAVRHCALRARERQVELVTEIAPDVPLVQMEPTRLIQAFQNVVDNAVQHSPAGGRVHVAAARAPDGARSVRCVVSDAGAGFRAEDQAHVFEPFFTRRRGGTGLGLSIVQKVVEEHGGTIQVGNRPEGGGIVTIELPAAQAAEAG